MSLGVRAKQHRTFIIKHAIVCAALFIAIAAARLLMLMGGGGSVPFWDQWGGENGIFSAFQNGTLTWGQMFAAHNEHRIFWTRVLTILLFELNGHQWDNQVEAVASNLIYCSALLIPVIVASLNHRRNQTIGIALIVLLAGALPFGWENTLVGFQSQFYINTLLAFLAIAVASFGGIGYRTGICISVLIVCSFAAMGNGVLTAFTCAAVLLTRSLPAHRHIHRGIALAAIAVTLGAVGYLNTPSPPYHAALKAQNFIEFTSALWITSSWPLSPGIGQLVLLVPVAFWMLIIGREQRTRADFFFLGLVCLGMLNAAAIAYSRGHDLVETTSRYTDTILPCSIATAYFAMRLIASGVRDLSVPIIGYGSCIAVVLGLFAQSMFQMPKFEERAYFLRMSTVNTADFLNGDDAAFKGKPNGHVPYPDPAHLGESLRTNDQSASLPTSVLGPLALSGRSLASTTGRCRTTTSARDHFSTISVDCDSTPPADPAAVSIATGRLSAALMLLRQKMDYSVLARGIPTSSPRTTSNQCSLDGINERPTSQLLLVSPLDLPIRLSGWAPPARFNFSSLSMPELRIVLAGERVAYSFNAGHSRTERPDVAKALKDASFSRSGFDVFIDPRDLQTGVYHVVLATGNGLYCDTGHKVELTQSTRPFAKF